MTRGWSSQSSPDLPRLQHHAVADGGGFEATGKVDGGAFASAPARNADSVRGMTTRKLIALGETRWRQSAAHAVWPYLSICSTAATRLDAALSLPASRARSAAA